MPEVGRLGHRQFAFGEFGGAFGGCDARDGALLELLAFGDFAAGDDKPRGLVTEPGEPVAGVGDGALVGVGRDLVLLE